MGVFNGFLICCSSSIIKRGPTLLKLEPSGSQTLCTIAKNEGSSVINYYMLREEKMQDEKSEIHANYWKINILQLIKTEFEFLRIFDILF